MSTIPGLSAAQFSYDMQTPPAATNKQREHAEQVRDGLMANLRDIDVELAEWTPGDLYPSQYDGFKLSIDAGVSAVVSEDVEHAMLDLAGRLELVAKCIRSRAKLDAIRQNEGRQ